MAEKKKKPNQLATLGIILGVLVVLVFFLANPFGLFKPSEEEREKKEGLSKLLCDFVKPNVTGFEIKPAGGEAFKLTKDSKVNKWFVQIKDKKYCADMQRIDKLLEEVPGLKSEGAATKSKDKYPTFEVDDAKGIGLKVFTDAPAPAVSLIIGKADTSYKGCFLLVENDPAVYRANANLKSLVGFEPKDYRTRNPWKFEPATATEITIAPPKGGAAPLTFTKIGELWQTGGKNGNQNLIKETIKKLSDATINDFLDAPDPATTQLAGKSPAIIVKAGVNTYKLILGASDANTAYAQDQDGWVYKTSSYSMKFYTDLAFDQLTFDDSKQDEAKAGAAPGAPTGMPPGAPGAGGTAPLPPKGGVAPPAGGVKPPSGGTMPPKGGATPPKGGTPPPKAPGK
jgi:hypothetical protein